MNGKRTRGIFTFLVAAGTCLAVQGSTVLADGAHAADREQGAGVSMEIALASLQSLADGHLQKMADSMHVLATSEAARSGDWARINGPYSELAKRNVQALNWFALPDGSYWSLQDGKEPGNLAGRDYFPRVLAGETIVGRLVYSTATGKPVAIVAVPVAGADGSIAGVLGASVYLDALSELLRDEMAIDEGQVFFSFDGAGIVALNWDPDLIFFEPRKSGDEGVTRAFDEMLSARQGRVSYTFRDAERTVVFRHSALTGWWYAFGLVR